MICSLIIFIFLIIHHARGEEFMCKAQPGCHFARCDPSPKDILAGLKKNEYSITCTSSEDKDDTSNDLLLDILTTNKNEIALLKAELDILKKENADIKSSAVTLSTSELVKIEDKIDDSADNLKNVIREADERLEARILTLELKNNQQSAKILDLEQKNRDLETNIQILSVSCPSGNSCNSVQNLVVTDSCKTNKLGGCLWIEVGEDKVSFPEAQTTCASYGAFVGVIPNQNTYNALLENARTKMSRRSDSFSLWTGMVMVNPSSSIEAHPPGFYSWRAGNPSSSSSRTNIFLEIRKDERSIFQGMQNFPPSFPLDGVICSKPRNG